MKLSDWTKEERKDDALAVWGKFANCQEFDDNELATCLIFGGKHDGHVATINTGKFVNQIVYIPDNQPESQLEADIDVLSAMVVYMADYYENIFSGLDEMIKAINDNQIRKG